MKGFHPHPTVRPVPDKTSSQRVYDELRRAMMHGELIAGTSLGENQVGAELGVSRTPVREAFGELLNQGLLEEGARRQVVVAAPTAELVQEIVLMRDALEPVLTHRAAQVMDVSDVDQLRLIMIRARRAIDTDDLNAFLDCDEDFHLHIPHATLLRLAEDTVRRLRGLNRLAIRRSEWDARQLIQIATEHDAIIDALAGGDGERAAAAMTRHLATSSRH
jgi:DNA-binding GntR family transcriptional regulator